MTTFMQNIPVKAAINTRSLLWLVVVGILATLLALLTKAIIDNPTPSQDIRVMDWVVGWDLWGLTTFFDVVSVQIAGVVVRPLPIANLASV